MCIVAIAHFASSRYPLIVAANRDERHARPSAPAAWWNAPGSLLAGRDLIAGGSWLGVTGTGRFAAVTNIFERSAHSTSESATVASRSRGMLVTEFLQSSAKPSEFAATVLGDRSCYGPFNLVLRDGDALHFVSNRHPAAELGPGIHVLGNNEPGLKWAKIDVLADAISQAADRDDLVALLLETLSGPHARGTLERAADSLFVVGDEFGTRCTTVLAFDADGRAEFVEKRFTAAGETEGLVSFSFRMPARFAG